MGSFGRERGVRGWVVPAEEAVMLGDIPVREEYGLGYQGDSVYRRKRRACPGNQSSSLMVGRLISAYAGMGRSP